MELKKVRSAGDPELVRRNKNTIDPLFPSLVAVFMQLMATLYLRAAGYSDKAVILSGTFTLIYVIVTYLLNKK